ncbi:MAG: hypothetical protein J0J04_04840 [Microbacterium sp.]|uniref:hypothetical protein n=1 Tax=Microbacterium sp. TaxID=51671 RepID=UPI001ACE25A6|nr:hypothetical protein [Microbacterium sp.]MBN9214135.1 hypothetical protein [Microbacterium sp.]
MNSNLNLVTAWNTLWTQLTAWAPGLGTFLAVVGMLVIVIFVGKWGWDKRRNSGGAGGFPVMAVIFGLLLAGPTIVIPVVLSILQVLFAIVVSAIGWFTSTIKS